MTDPVVSIEPSLVTVQPGGQARVVVTIANAGSIVDGYRVDVVDEVSGRGRVSGPARWCQVLLAEGPETTGHQDATVSVYPQQNAQVVVVFSPGTGPDVPGGSFAFGVRVMSVVDRSACAVAEGDVEIGRVFGLQAKLVPVNSTGRWSGNHVVQVSNWGNAPARLRLAPSDPDQALGYLVRPEVLDVPLGGTAAARVKVRTRRPRLRGQVSRLPFSITGEPESVVFQPGAAPGVPDPARPVVDGAFSQKPILSRAVVSTVALTAVTAVAVGAFAFLNRPKEPTVEEFGVPATPVLAPAVAVGPTQITLAWAPVPNVSGYKLEVAEGTGNPQDTQQLDKALGGYSVKDLEPGTQYCFQLASLRGDVSSPRSAKVCATTKPPVATTTPGDTSSTTATGTTSTAPTDTTTATPSGTTTTTPSGTTTTTPATGFAPTDWIGMVYLRATEVPGARENAEGLRDALVARRVPGKVLLTSDYPKFGFSLKGPTWVVYLGPFPSSAAAVAACTAIRDATPPPEDCLPAQPAPGP